MLYKVVNLNGHYLFSVVVLTEQLRREDNVSTTCYDTLNYVINNSREAHFASASALGPQVSAPESGATHPLWHSPTSNVGPWMNEPRYWRHSFSFLSYRSLCFLLIYDIRDDSGKKKRVLVVLLYYY